MSERSSPTVDRRDEGTQTRTEHLADATFDMSSSHGVGGDDHEFIGDYQIVGRIAQGGMGVVYRARQLTPSRMVALKTIRPDRFAREENVRRFDEEAQAIASLEHPNIVPIYEVGRWEGLHFFTMRLMDGGSLSSNSASLRNDLRSLAKIMSDVARALHHAHQFGILHRDLKPSNILMDLHARPYVADFGLAQRFKPGDLGSDEEGIVGTPSFMSPEQADPNVKRLTTATDIYGLGAILYSIMTGQPPFSSKSTVETLNLIRAQPPIPPHQLDKRIDADLEAICLRCLEKDPARRYASASDLADDLERFREGRPVEARPQTVGLVVRKWAKRRPVTATLLALLFLTASAGVAGITWSWQIAERNADLARRRAYAANLRLADRELDRANLDSVDRLLRQTGSTEPRGSADLRGFEWYYLDRQRSLERLKLSGHDMNSPYALAIDREGKRVASAGADLLILIHDLASGRLLDSYSTERTVNELVFSRDGKKLITIESSGRIRFIDLSTKRDLLEFPAHKARGLGITISPRGDLLATCDMDGLIKIWDAENGALLNTLTGHEGSVCRVAFDPTGARLVSGGRDKTVRCWDVATGQEIRRQSGHNSTVVDVAYSPTGDEFATADDAGSILIWNAADGRLIRALADRASETATIAYSPDGKRLAAGGADQTISIWALADESKPLVLRGHTDSIFDIEFLPDGKSIASASRDQTVRIWDIGSDGSAEVIGRTKSNFDTFALSQSGRWFAAGGTDGILHIWDSLAIDQTVQVAEDGEQAIFSVAFSPDEKLLASADEAGKLFIRDVTTGSIVHELRGHASAIREVRFSPDGKSLASAGEDGTVRFWNAATGQIRWTVQEPKPPAYCVEFTRDGQTLLVGSNTPRVAVLDVRSGKMLRELPSRQEGVFSLAISPDSKTIAGVEGRSILLWNLSSGRLIKQLNGHKGLIYSLDFSPDGARLASGSTDESIRLWELVLGQELLSLRGHEASVIGVRFARDGKSLFSAAQDGTVRRWDATP
jgi:WD40 repeat protein